jgi:hypothetical protein
MSCNGYANCALKGDEALAKAAKEIDDDGDTFELSRIDMIGT